MVLLTQAIPWKDIQNKFQDLYSSRGAPSHPIRKMVGVLLLQHIYQLSGEDLGREHLLAILLWGSATHDTTALCR